MAAICQMRRYCKFPIEKLKRNSVLCSKNRSKNFCISKQKCSFLPTIQQALFLRINMNFSRWLITYPYSFDSHDATYQWWSFIPFQMFPLSNRTCTTTFSTYDLAIVTAPTLKEKKQKKISQKTHTHRTKFAEHISLSKNESI